MKHEEILKLLMELCEASESIHENIKKLKQYREIETDFNFYSMMIEQEAIRTKILLKKLLRKMGR